MPDTPPSATHRDPGPDAHRTRLAALIAGLPGAEGVRILAIANGTARLVIDTPSDADDPALATALQGLAGQLAGVARIEIARALPPPPQLGAAPAGPQPLPGVDHVILVGAGKGGVGKSTVAVNLALGLAAQGRRVGLLDADLYGPSAHRMLGVAGRPVALGDRLVPLAAHGIVMLSAGAIFAPDEALIWRGPVLVNTLRQLVFDVAWPPLDVLVVDLPPGTGDIALSLAQQVDLTGAIVVTTPQDISLIDTRRAIDLFDRLEVPLLGLVENMALHVCSRCGHAEAIFKQGGGEDAARAAGIPFLGRLPLAATICETGDAGHPFVLTPGPEADAMQAVVAAIDSALFDPAAG